MSTPQQPQSEILAPPTGGPIETLPRPDADAEQLGTIASQITANVGQAFSQFPDYVSATQAEDGTITRSLDLHREIYSGWISYRVTEESRPDGTITTQLQYTPDYRGWSFNTRITQTPGQPIHMEAGKADWMTGQFVPNPPVPAGPVPLGSKPEDLTYAHRDIKSGVSYWPENIQHGIPEKPGKVKQARKAARRAITGFFN